MWNGDKEDATPELDEYKYCDINGDGHIDITDIGRWITLANGYCRHLEEIEKVYLDLGENALITECGCNK